MEFAEIERLASNWFNPLLEEQRSAFRGGYDLRVLDPGAAVWTGSEMIVWGSGSNGFLHGSL